MKPYQEFKALRVGLGISVQQACVLFGGPGKPLDRSTIHRWQADPGTSKTANTPPPIALKVLRWVKQGKIRLEDVLPHH